MGRLVRFLLLAIAIPSVMMFGAWTSTGCDDGGDGDGDADSDSDSDSDGDGDADCSTDPDDGENAIFIVDLLEIGDDTVGFDLDGVDTPDECDTDFCRNGQVDGPGGVDNRLGPLLGSIAEIAPEFDANTSIADAMIEGSLLILFDMRDVDNWTNDGCVPVFAYVGHDPNDEPGIFEGREYMVDSRSLEDPSDLDSALISFEDGSITGGTYTGGPDEFSLNVPISDVGNLEIQITDTMLQWDASAAGAANGVIGGFVTIHDMLDALRRIEEAQGFITMAPTIMENQADIDAIPADTEIPGTTCTPDNVGTYNAEGEGCGSSSYTCSASGRCVEPADHFDGISLALTFTAIPASIGGIYIDEE